MSYLRITRNRKYSVVDGKHKIERNDLGSPNTVELIQTRRLRRTPSQLMAARQAREAAKARKEEKQFADVLQKLRKNMASIDCQTDEEEFQVVMPKIIPIDPYGLFIYIFIRQYS